MWCLPSAGPIAFPAFRELLMSASTRIAPEISLRGMPAALQSTWRSPPSSCESAGSLRYSFDFVWTLDKAAVQAPARASSRCWRYWSTARTGLSLSRQFGAESISSVWPLEKCFHSDRGLGEALSAYSPACLQPPAPVNWASAGHRRAHLGRYRFAWMSSFRLAASEPMGTLTRIRLLPRGSSS